MTETLTKDRAFLEGIREEITVLEQDLEQARKARNRAIGQFYGDRKMAVEEMADATGLSRETVYGILNKQGFVGGRKVV